MELHFEIPTQIQKPVKDVFDAFVNPDKLCGYFTETASGPLEEGAQVQWTWKGYPDAVTVTVRQIIPNKKIVFEWPAHKVDDTLLTAITFDELATDKTKITIRESGWGATDAGLQSSYMNCQGWQNMLDCMKAYLRFAVDLRKA